MQQPMETGEFVDLVKRNAAGWHQGIRCIASRWGRVQGAPPGTCTLVWGAARPGRPLTAINIAMNRIPQETIINPETDEVVYRGWKSALKMLLQQKAILPRDEIRRLFDDKEFYQMRKAWDIPCV